MSQGEVYTRSVDGISTEIKLFQEYIDGECHGAWVVRHEGLGLVTQGNSYEEAVEAMREYFRFLGNYLAEKLVPRRGPDHHWVTIEDGKKVKGGTKVGVCKTDEQEEVTGGFLCASPQCDGNHRTPDDICE